MSLFQWFTRKYASAPSASVESSGLGHVDPTLPFQPGAKGYSTKVTMTSPGSAANRKNERLERREQLYAVVRDAMTKAGVLSASYKFKVLSLDSRGLQFLVMMDLARKYAGATERLAEIEGLIAQNARARHEILVTAVYWRVNEHVTAGLSHSSAPVPLAAAPATAPPPKPRFEPLQEEEVAAFKQALASVPSNIPLVAPGEVVKSGRRNPAPPRFADTEIDERASPLSGTQYGDLV
jgi:hypothetical protein